MGYLFSCAGFDNLNAYLCIAGIPTDKNASYIKGAKYAPNLIRSSSLKLETYLPDLDIDLQEIPFTDIGDIKEVNKLRKRKYIFLGGDHSITRETFAKVRNKDTKYICIDAHPDFRKEYNGNPNSNACVNYKISEMIGRENMSILGIRTGSKEEFKEPFKKEIKGDVYLSIDIDVLDPSVVSCVGNPEPGGWTFLELIGVIKDIFNNPKINVIAADLVELSTKNENISSITAAKIVQYLIALMGRK